MGDRYREHRGVEQLSPTRFRIRVRAVDPKTGKEVSRQKTITAESKDEAIEARREFLAEIRAGGETAERPKVRECALSWLKRRGRRVRASTRARYATAVEVINTSLGDYYVDQMRPVDVEQWQDEMMEVVRENGKPYATTTINGWLRVLRQIARDAARNHGTPVFTDGVATLAEGEVTGARAASVDAKGLGRLLLTTRALARAGDLSVDVARGIETLAWTGLRIGEFIALQWSDLVEGELHITRGVWRRELGPTKTRKPRVVYVVPPLAKVLEDQRQWLLEEQHEGLPSGLMFPASPQQAFGGAERRGGEVSWYRSPTALVNGLKRVCEAAGLPRMSPHALRRTYEDALRAAGVESLVRRSMAGWSGERVQGGYATVRTQERAQAGEAFVALVVTGGGDPLRRPETLAMESAETSAETPGPTAETSGAQKGFGRLG